MQAFLNDSYLALVTCSHFIFIERLLVIIENEVEKRSDQTPVMDLKTKRKILVDNCKETHLQIVLQLGRKS